MRALIVLVLLTASADAGPRMAMFGLGTAIANEETGWVARVEGRFEGKADADLGPQAVVGGRIGIDIWSAGAHRGVTIPMGWYLGGAVGNVRSTLGGGLGLWSFETSKSPVSGGLAPYACASIEGAFGTLAVSLDARLTRQLLGDMADFNVFSVIVMAGRRWD